MLTAPLVLPLEMVSKYDTCRETQTNWNGSTGAGHMGGEKAWGM